MLSLLNCVVSIKYIITLLISLLYDCPAFLAQRIARKLVSGCTYGEGASQRKPEGTKGE